MASQIRDSHYPFPKAYERPRPVTAEDIAVNKCASPYIGEPFGQNSVGGKWLMGE